MQLRDYQIEADSQIADCVAQGGSPVLVLGTGLGKTAVMAHRTMAFFDKYYQAAVAHRQELVGQIAMAYAKFDVPHRIVAPPSVVADARRAQLEILGYHRVDQRSKVGVCSVDTLNARDLEHDTWARSVAISHDDECAHVLRANAWGKAKTKFPSLKSSIGYTATPHRADRKGIGAHASGFYTDIVLGPQMWQAMEWGYLTQYRLVTGKVTDLDMTNVAISANGDYNPQQMRNAVKKSRQIVGDAVETYRKFCSGKKALLFAVDVEDACRYRDAFAAAGFKAEVVTADTKPDIRRAALRSLASGALDLICNVDLFGEGTDIPAVECVIQCRPTKSQALDHQQKGRALRLFIEKWLMDRWHSMSAGDRMDAIRSSTKPFAWILDLARNWAEPAVGGLPDARGRVWTTDDRAKGGKSGPSDVAPVRACVNPEPVDAGGMLCTGVYERFLTACPFCGHAPVPQGRTIEQVDGDVSLVDDETLARLRGEYLAAHTTPSYGGPHAAALYARHRERHAELSELQQTMEWWGPSYEIEQGRKLTDREQQKAFYLTFGVTTLEALSLKRADAEALRNKVLDWLKLKGFTIPA